MINIIKKIPIIGIYKITSPSGKIYIGQSVNIQHRKYVYKSNCSKQQIIYKSFLKYGFENHKFEIIEECSISKLDELEIWYKLCCVIDMGWSNCLFCHIIDGKGGYKSDETRRKISEARLGFAPSFESIQKRIKTITGTKYNINPLKINGNKNKSKPINFGKLISKLKKGKPLTNKYKPIIQYDLNMNPIKEWSSIKEASEVLKMNKSDICNCCKGKQNTSKGFIWKYK